MTRPQRHAALSVLVSVGLLSGCGDGTTTTGPTTTAGERSFLEGTWRGPVTIHRADLPDTNGTTTWTFALLPNTGQTSFRTTLTVDHPWLQISTSASSVILPATPGGRLSTHGSYASPRVCEGQFKAAGTAERDRIETHLEGVDCLQLPETAVFSGDATLTRVR